MNIQIDSREKPRATVKIIKEFDRQGVQHYVSKLYVGDYMSLDNPRLIVDRKQNLTEVAANVCQDHDRFVNEIKRAQQNGIQLIFLVEHSREITTVNDVHNWVNPRLKKSTKALTGHKLQTILLTIQAKYKVQFLFCDKDHTGQKIIEILRSGDIDNGRD